LKDYLFRIYSEPVIPSRAQESRLVHVELPWAWNRSGNSSDKSINGSRICDT